MAEAMQEWFTAAELAELALPDMPNTGRGVQMRASREGWQAPPRAWSPDAPTGQWRRRQGRGGGIEYHYSLLPLRAQARLVGSRLAGALRSAGETGPAGAADRAAAKRTLGAAEAWAHFERLPDAKKDQARAWLETIEAVHALVRGGTQKDLAVRLVCQPRGIGASTYYRRESCTHGIPRADWLPHLVDRRTGRTATVECSPEAWEALKADYLRPERPTLETCYRRLQRIAAERGWTLPAARTLARRLEREIPAPVMVLCRDGEEALKRLYPPQRRDRSSFHALEAVNADGHKWDVFVRWPDGSVGRPNMVAIQDLYSGLILSFRIDKTENKECVRLAIGDMVETYGVPDRIWLDNGRGFASKWITGGTATRYRFKMKEEEPLGILTQLGVQVHWTNPYSGQSKPIERAFRDFCAEIVTDPRLAGATTGNSPTNKPANYGSRAVDLELFQQVVADGIALHNARPGRTARTARGRSFQDTFAASYADAPIRQAPTEWRRLWLLAAEGVRADRQSGALTLMDNRYWSEFLSRHRGQKLLVRFDPQDLHAGLHVYRLDGAYLGHAACWQDAGFADVAAGRDHNAARRQFMRAAKEMAQAVRRMSIDELAEMLPPVVAPAPPTPSVPRPYFGASGNLAVAASAAEAARPDREPDREIDTETFDAAFQRGLRLVVGGDD